jgi:hypothetical protein
MQETIARALMLTALLGWPLLGLMLLTLSLPRKRVRPASDAENPGTSAPQRLVHRWLPATVWIMWLVPVATYAASLSRGGIEAQPLLIFAAIQLVGTAAVFSVAWRSSVRLPFSHHVCLVMAMIGGGLGIQMSMLVPSAWSSDAQAGIGIFLSMIYAPGIAAWCGLLAWGGASLVTRYLARRNEPARP